MRIIIRAHLISPCRSGIVGENERVNKSRTARLQASSRGTAPRLDAGDRAAERHRVSVAAARPPSAYSLLTLRKPNVRLRRPLSCFVQLRAGLSAGSRLFFSGNSAGGRPRTPPASLRVSGGSAAFPLRGPLPPAIGRAVRPWARGLPSPVGGRTETNPRLTASLRFFSVLFSDGGLSPYRLKTRESYMVGTAPPKKRRRQLKSFDRRNLQITDLINWRSGRQQKRSRATFSL